MHTNIQQFDTLNTKVIQSKFVTRVCFQPRTVTHVVHNRQCVFLFLPVGEGTPGVTVCFSLPSSRGRHTRCHSVFFSSFQSGKAHQVSQCVFLFLPVGEGTPGVTVCFLFLPVGEGTPGVTVCFLILPVGEGTPGVTVCFSLSSSRGRHTRCHSVFSHPSSRGRHTRCHSVFFSSFQSGKAHQVSQFHIVNWNADGRCSNLKTITDVIEEVTKVQMRTGNNPIVVHCRWG